VFVRYFLNWEQFMNVNIYVNGKSVTPQEQSALTVKNEVVSRIVHHAAARHEKARKHPGASNNAGK
jgi:hypothetical protein